MPKLLLEFLQEKQEPFSLDLYLLDRGLSTSASSVNSDQVLKRSIFRRRYERSKPVQNCTEFVRVVFGRLVPHLNSKKISKSGNGGRKGTSPTATGGREDEKDEIFSCTDVTNCSSKNECLEQEADAYSNSSIDYCRKQLSPVSILEGTEFHQGHRLTMNDFPPIQADSLKPKHHPTHYNRIEKLDQLIRTDSYSGYIINKRTVEPTKQLLVDCVREVIQIQRRGDQRTQESVPATNIVCLLHCDFLAFVEEWNADYEQNKKDVSMEIGDAILEGLLHQIVAGCG